MATGPMLASGLNALRNFMLYPLSGLVPRDPGLWVFGNVDDKFEGNSKYLFFWVSSRDRGVSAIWITADRALRDRLRRQGFRAELRWSPKGMAAALRAGAFVFNYYPGDIGAALSKGALLVNLWHGSGLKALGHGNANSALGKRHGGWRGLYRRAARLSASLVPDVLIASSPSMAERFADQFRIPRDRCPVIGTPRLDAASDPELKALVQRHEPCARWNEVAEAHDEIHVYMPTFREDRRDFMADALPDPDRLQAVLAARNAVLYLKLHPWTRTAMVLDHPNIKPWPKGLDFYSVMDEVDCLITDYSSVMFDYLHVRSSGLVLYPFDYDRYVSERSLYFSYDDSVAGTRADTFDRLCDAIVSGEALGELPPDRVASVRRRCWEGSVAPASPAVAAAIAERLRDR